MDEDTAIPDRAALADAVQDLYRVFAYYALPPHIDACPHCVADSDHALLHARPLPELTWRELARYAWKAMTTWGNADDFRHFLPRLLELVAEELDPVLARADEGFQVFPYNHEVLFGKLALAGWGEWPKKERDAIQTYLLAFWRRLLAAFPAAIPVEIGISSIGRAVDDLAPFLAAWRSDERLPATRHLAEFVRHECAAVSRTPLRNVWWAERPQHGSELAAWLRNPRTRDQLERAFFAHADSPFAADLSQAVDCFPWDVAPR